MINHKMSESEEMYLITIAGLIEQGVEAPVSIARLSKELAIQPVSANQMVHRLAEEGFLNYFPYKGVELTEQGERAALEVLRDRRLWEVFLVDHLELPPDEADALACRLEHITPAGVTCRLAKFLGYPSISPQGLPIPPSERESPVQAAQPISRLDVGQKAEVARIEGDQATRSFFEAAGLRPGRAVRVLATKEDQTMLLAVGERRVHVDGELAEAITVSTGNNQPRY